VAFFAGDVGDGALEGLVASFDRNSR